MKNDFRVALTFSAELPGKIKIKTSAVTMHGIADKKRDGLINGLRARAVRDSLDFRKRKLSMMFNPVFGGFVFFSDAVGLGDEDAVGFARLFFDKLEEYFHVSVVYYHLIDIGDITPKGGCSSKIFDFEIFNYNFYEHRAVKTELTGAKNIKKLNELAEFVLAECSKFKFGDADEGSLAYTLAAKEKEEMSSDHVNINDEGDVDGRIGLSHESWMPLDPSENAPVLERGEPREIRKVSSVRIYFQKPGVRQVVWRFRDKPGTSSEKPILRVYVDDKMLWYERLDSRFGSRYIIFSDDYELCRTWVDIGYVNEKGMFTFVARSPIWPPKCFSKSLPKANSRKRVPKEISMIGASEGIPGGERLPVNLSDPGYGFSGLGIKKQG